MKKCVLVFFCFMFLIQASCLAHKGITLTDGKFLDRYQSLAYSLDTDIAVEARIMQRLPEKRNGNEIVYSFVTNELTGVAVFKDSETNNIRYITFQSYNEESNKSFPATVSCVMYGVGISPSIAANITKQLAQRDPEKEPVMQSNGRYVSIRGMFVPLVDEDTGVFISRSMVADAPGKRSNVFYVIYFQWDERLEWSQQY